MKNLHIRDARETDWEAIHAVTLSAYEEYASFVPPELIEEYRQEVLATIDGDGPVERIVAEQEGIIVGSALLFPAGTTIDTPSGPIRRDWPEVRLLAVLPSARGRGVGLALMQECIARTRRSGIAMLTLHTTDMMQAAIRLYERIGFVRAPELDFRPVEEMLVKGYRLTLADTPI